MYLICQLDNVCARCLGKVCCLKIKQKQLFFILNLYFWFSKLCHLLIYVLKTKLLTISSGLSIPNCTLLTVRRGALLSVAAILMAIADWRLRRFSSHLRFLRLVCLKCAEGSQISKFLIDLYASANYCFSLFF